MSDSDELKKLYERFKADLNGRADEMYYDEDDLIMVFDLAGDYADRYVQLNVLMLGRKLYPESESLELRFGFAMLDMYEDVSLDDFLQKNSNRKGVLWDILRLRCSGHKGDALNAFLDNLVSEYRFDEDEAIIQFVNLVVAGGCEQWLADNYRKFVDRCAYADTALGECAEVLRYHDENLAINLVEELTRIDPFNADAWVKLAELYRDSGNTEDGLSAISYAAALRTDMPHQKYVEATLLLNRDPASAEAARLLQDVVKSNPEITEAKIALSDVYDCQGKTDLAEMIWQEELYRNPDDELALARLSMLGAKLPEGKEIAWVGADTPEDAVEQRVNLLLQTGTEESRLTAMYLLETYDRTHGLYQLAGEYIKLLYCFGQLDKLCRFMERERPEGSPEMRLDPPSVPLYAASLLRLGRYDEAESTVNEYIMKTAQVCNTVELKMAFAGVKMTLEYIHDRAAERNYSFDRDPIAESFA